MQKHITYISWLVDYNNNIITRPHTSLQ